MRPESETKHKLLSAALNLILGNSYGSVSVDDICKRAGVQKGSFYHFFPSKSDLAVAAFEDYWENTRRPYLDRVFSPQTPPLQRFDDYGDQLYDLQRERFKDHGKVVGCPFNLVGSELSTQDEKIRQKCQEYGDRVCRYFESALRDAIRDGAIHDVDVTLKASELYSLTMGILMQARIRNDLEMIKTVKSGIHQLLGLIIKERRASPYRKPGPLRSAAA